MNLQLLRDRLKRAGLTQVEVGNLLGVGHSQVSRLLSGKSRMRVDTLTAIEALLEKAENAAAQPGVAETRAPFRQPPRFVTLEEARKPNRAPPMSQEDQERFWREIIEIGQAAKHLPRVTDMTDDEILGYDDME